MYGNRFSEAFSLIELMVVIAIVAILSVIALPSYRDYTTKAKMTAGLVILDRMKGMAAEYYSVNGSFPSLANLNKVSTDFATNTLASGNMNSTGWTGAASGSDTTSPFVEITYNSDTIPNVAAPKLAYIATVNGSSVTWACYTYQASATTNSINTKFLPQGCTVHP